MKMNSNYSTSVLGISEYISLRLYRMHQFQFIKSNADADVTIRVTARKFTMHQ